MLEMAWVRWPGGETAWEVAQEAAQEVVQEVAWARAAQDSVGEMVQARQPRGGDSPGGRRGGRWHSEMAQSEMAQGRRWRG